MPEKIAHHVAAILDIAINKMALVESVLDTVKLAMTACVAIAVLVRTLEEVDPAFGVLATKMEQEVKTPEAFDAVMVEVEDLATRHNLWK